MSRLRLLLPFVLCAALLVSVLMPATAAAQEATPRAPIEIGRAHV